MEPKSTPESPKGLIPDDPVEILLGESLRGEPEGWWDAVESAARRHPEYADDLRGRFRVLFELGGLHGDAAEELPHSIDDLSILDELGRGGMGIVYRAHEPSLGRDVAVKVVRPSRLEFEGAAQRFQREVEAMAQLSHPSIVTIHRVGLHSAMGGAHAEGPVPYFTMELLAGASLAQVCASLAGRSPESLDGVDLFHAVGGEGPPPEAFALPWPLAVARIVRDVARALHHAHGKDVIHRDVKPSNILLEPSGRVVLLDFGLTSSASGAGGTASSTAPVGTYAYMAPEQWRAERAAGPAADIYGLGATLYELLALAPPFEGTTVLEMRAAVEAGETPSLRARNRAVPRDLALVQAMAMDARPAGRYDTAEAFASDLDRVLEGEPVLAAPPGPVARWARRARRRPAAALAWGLGAALVIGGPIAYGLLAKRHASAMERLAQSESQAKDRAITAKAELEDVLGFTQELFRSARPEINGGRARNAVDMLHDGAEAASSLETSPGSKARINLTLGWLFSLLMEPRAAEGPFDSAIAHYRQGSTAEDRLRLTEALRRAAHNRALLGEHAKARPTAEEALALATDLYGANAEKTAAFHMTLADVQSMTGDHGEAAVSRQRALEILEGAGASERRILEARALLGTSLLESGDRARGRALTTSAVAWAIADPERTTSPFWLAELSLANDELGAGELDASMERVTRLHDELVARAGKGSVLTAQAGMVRARVLGARGDMGGARVQLEGVQGALAATLPLSHPLRIDADRNLVAVLTNLGESETVLAIEDERDIAARTEEAFGEGSDEHARLRMAIGLAAQARGQNQAALLHLEALERARRAMGPWNGPHGDAVLLLTAHRMRMGAELPEGGQGASITLLDEMIDAVGDGELPVVSSANGQTYEGGTMARLFLAGILDQTPGGAARAASLKAEAEVRKRAIMARTAPK